MYALLLVALAALDVDSSMPQHKNYSISASAIVSVVPEFTGRASAEGFWNISPGEDGYRCGWQGLTHKTGGRTPLPYHPYGALIYQEEGASDWKPFVAGMRLYEGMEYSFRCNDTDMSNQGALTLKLTPIRGALAEGMVDSRAWALDERWTESSGGAESCRDVESRMEW